MQATKALIRRTWAPIAVAAALIASAAAPITGQPNPYTTIERWGQLPEGRTWGSTSAVDVAPERPASGSPNAAAPTLARARTCRRSSSSTRPASSSRASAPGLFVFPHGISRRQDGNVWVTDGAGQGRQGPPGLQVQSRGQGAADARQGRRRRATDRTSFNQPSDVVIAPNGDIFVADGHDASSNARIVKFTKDGKFIKTWGKTGIGARRVRHAARPRVRFAGTAVRRPTAATTGIQIFDQDGKFLEEWKQFSRPSGIYIDKNDILYVRRFRVEHQDATRAGSGASGSAA